MEIGTTNNKGGNMTKTTFRLSTSRPKSKAIVSRLILNKSNRVQVKNGEYIVDVYTY